MLDQLSRLRRGSAAVCGDPSPRPRRTVTSVSEPAGPGAIVLIGSGEAARVGRDALAWLGAGGRRPASIAVLETAAGFELNSAAVAGRWTKMLRECVPGAEVEQIPARRRGTPFTPDDPTTARPILASDAVAIGAGSPTYAARQLRGSAAWTNVQAAHLLGASLLLASAGAVAAGTYVLPVYEIFKVGEEPHWKDGLRLFEHYGLTLAVVSHWDNAEGGDGLDTSRCFIGLSRFSDLLAMLPRGAVVLGIDEHTAVAMDPVAGEAHVIGRGGATVIRDGHERTFESGARFVLGELGPFAVPDATTMVTPASREAVLEARVAEASPRTSAEVDALVASRREARERGDFAAADRLRGEIAQRGWDVEDTAGGPRVRPRR